MYDLLNPLKPDTKFLVFFSVTIQPLNGRLTMTDTKMSASKNSVGRLPNNSERLFSPLINNLLTKGFGDMDPYDLVVKLRDLCANNQLTHAQLNAANAENERFKRLLQANNIPVEPVAVTTTPTSTKVRKRALGNRALAKKQKTGKKRVVVDLSRSVPTKNNELLYDPYSPVPKLKKPPSYSKENIVDHANVPKARSCRQGGFLAHGRKAFFFSVGRICFFWSVVTTSLYSGLRDRNPIRNFLLASGCLKPMIRFQGVKELV